MGIKFSSVLFDEPSTVCVAAAVVAILDGFTNFVMKSDVFINLLFAFCSETSDKQFSLKFNEKDGQVERKSLSGLYKIENGRPR